MDKEHVRDYINKYKDSYSRESIEKQLLNSGAKKEDIYEVYRNSNTGIFPPNPNAQVQKSHSGVALTLVILGFFIPFFGFFLKIFGLVLGHRARKVNPNDGMALASLIIGYIGLVISLMLILIIGALMFRSVDYVMLPDKIDMSGYTIRGDPTLSILRGDEVDFVFTYMGAQVIQIDSDGTLIRDYMNSECVPVSIRNADTSKSSDGEAGVEFLNSQTGIIKFKCDKQYLIGDALEGTITIASTNTKSGLRFNNDGVIRLTAR